MWKLAIVLWAGVAWRVQGARGSEYDEYSGAPKGAPQKVPLILMHKQALSNNGDFNFAFASDNGLKQGEKIHPDGSRTGAYSYVDPNGKTISVKYSAGKDGFRILEGDHVPKAIQVTSALPSSPYHSAEEGHGGQRSAPFVARPNFPFASSSNLDSGELYPRPLAGGAPPPSAPLSVFRAAQPQHRAPYKIYEDSSQELPSTGGAHVAGLGVVGGVPGGAAQFREQAESDEDVHKGPHSFGSGYAFEFSAAGKNPQVDYAK